MSVQGQYFTYPPFAAVFFVPLELLGDFGARLALTLASIGCYVVVVVVCARRLRMNVAAAAIVGLIGLSLEPFARTFLLGQINLVLLALVVIDCLVVPARYRGMLIGIAAGITAYEAYYRRILARLSFFSYSNGSGGRWVAPLPFSLLPALWAQCSPLTPPGSSGVVDSSSCLASVRMRSSGGITSP